MLDPANDRLDYCDLLRPPADSGPGFELEMAVAMTYSLDLKAMFAALLPLGFSGDSASHCRENPAFMLYAVRKLLPRLYVFADAGSIKSPSESENRLLTLLDRAVFPVVHTGAFHPKLWLLKFRQGGALRYRLGVLSRNLTCDRSWDVAMWLEGKPVAKPTENGSALAQLCSWVYQTQRGKSKRLGAMKRLVEELPRVEFHSADCKEIRILPLGVGAENPLTRSPLLQSGFQRLLVISPFLTQNWVERLFARGGEGSEKILITRRAALAGWPRSEVSCHVLKDQALFSSRDEVPMEDLHAKLYLLQKYENTTPYLFLGSMNATANATDGTNVELLLQTRLYGNRIFEKIREELLPSDAKGLFEQIQQMPESGETPSDRVQKQLQQQLATLLKLSFRASTGKTESGYQVVVSVKNLPDLTCRAELAPWSGEWQLLRPEMRFAVQSVDQLTDFYRLRLCLQEEVLERLLVIDTLSQEKLEKERMCEVVRRQLSRVEDLELYLACVLSANAYLMACLVNHAAPDRSGKSRPGVVGAALYEQLLFWLAKDKSRVLELESLLDETSLLTGEPFQKLLDLCRLFLRLARGKR